MTKGPPLLSLKEIDNQGTAPTLDWMQDDEVNHPHDHLVRKMFGEPETAASFFRAYLPDSVGKQVTAGNLHCEPASFIDGSLRGSAADLLFRVGEPGEEEGMFLYCLFEHQRQPDKWMPLRLLRYMVRIWESYLEKHPGAVSLPPVLPIVLHQGKSGWGVAKTFGDLVDMQEEIAGDIRQALPDFSFFLVDLAGIPFERIEGNLAGRLTLQALKAVAEDKLGEFLDVSGSLLKAIYEAETPSDLGLVLLKYFFFTDTSVDKQAFQGMVKTLDSPPIEEATMTLAEQYKQEGIEQGIETKEREIVLHMNATGMDVDTIAQATGIPQPKVLQYLAG